MTPVGRERIEGYWEKLERLRRASDGWRAEPASPPDGPEPETAG